MKIDRFVSIVATLHNDADIVESYIRDTIPVLRDNYTNYELVLVDDGSRDETVAKVTALLTEYEGIRLLRLSREFGEEVAITAGLDTVIGDFTVVMLPCMDPPDMIPELVRRCMDGIDVVFGVLRIHSSQSWLARQAGNLFFWYCRRLLKLDLPRYSTQFRCLSRQAVNAIIRIKDSYRYLRLFSTFVGYERQQFLYDPLNRGGKYKPRGFFQSVNQAIALIIENSPHPLRFVSWLGLLAATGNLFYVAYVFGVYLFSEDIAKGWTTLSLQSAGQFFLISVILTALCEYTGRMLNRLRDRPLYYLMEERNSSVLLVDKERHNIVEESRHVEFGSIKRQL
jgi:glycosyltransferase involved in cell wall biosynthesis